MASDVRCSGARDRACLIEAARIMRASWSAILHLQGAQGLTCSQLLSIGKRDEWQDMMIETDGSASIILDRLHIFEELACRAKAY